MESDTYRRCVNHARRVLPPDPALEAEDLVHSAYVKAAPVLAGLPSELDRLRLLFRCVNQVATDHRRRVQRRPVMVLEDWHPDGADVEGEALDRAALAPYLLAAQTDPQLLAVLLLALGYDIRAAGLLMGCAPVTVSTRAHRWRQAHTEA